MLFKIAVLIVTSHAVCGVNSLKLLSDTKSFDQSVHTNDLGTDVVEKSSGIAKLSDYASYFLRKLRKNASSTHIFLEVANSSIVAGGRNAAATSSRNDGRTAAAAATASPPSSSLAVAHRAHDRETTTSGLMAAMTLPGRSRRDTSLFVVRLFVYLRPT